MAPNTFVYYIIDLLLPCKGCLNKIYNRDALHVDVPTHMA